MSVMKHQFVVTDRYKVLQQTEKLDGSSTDQHLSVACFDGNVWISSCLWTPHFIIKHFFFKKKTPTVVTRESQFEELCALRKMAVSLAIWGVMDGHFHYGVFMASHSHGGFFYV